ncbi:mannose-1-phosphate guanyltransferase [Maricurvus nonylphenolicus]
MLQDTCLRLEGLETSAPIVVCGEDHRFTVAEQLKAVGMGEDASILLEPCGRNTAPAVALAALLAAKAGEDPILLVLAADHVIRDTESFHSAVKNASDMAEQGGLVSFGVVPTSPETGYGYIKRGELVGEGYRVDAFIEKPNLDLAKEYLEEGYLWNSGMFVFKASVFLRELGKYRSDILEVCDKAMGAVFEDIDFIRPCKEAFQECSSESIDYAVMEKTGDAMVVPVSCGWSDVGSWNALWDVSEKDSQNNVICGDVLTHDVSGCYVRNEDKLIALVGVRDLVVVESDDAIMVAHKDRAQDVKSIVSCLKASEREEADLHRKVFRPWGYYDSIDFGERFQVKRIVVNPGEKLSLQMHHHRAEHWIVVSGTAKVTKSEEVFLVSENESTYIPIGVKHRLENPGAIPLEMIEVQSGSYLGEDDILRFEDSYGR